MLTAASGVFAAALLESRPAAAEIPLVDTRGWKLSTDGRVNSFLSVAEGDGLPDEEPPILAAGTNDNSSPDGLHSTRIRNGYLTSILGFTGSKELGSNLKVTVRVALWMNAAGSRTQNVAGLVDPRELYAKLEGPWGSLLLGSDNDLSRGALLIDLRIAHEYGLGYPCDIVNATGVACGMEGFGAPFPWYNAGFVYSTPNLVGFQLSFGAYDPATIENPQLARTPLPRFEVELKFDFKEMFHLFSSGFWQVMEGTLQEPNALTGMAFARNLHTDAWGSQAGGMWALGPVMVGGAAFTGNGYSPLALQSQLSADSTGVLRNSRGAFGLGSFLIDALRLKIAGGLGVWHLDKNADEPGPVSATGAPTNPALIQENLGMTVGVYQATEPVHFALEYFRAQHTWYDRGVGTAANPTLAVGVITPQQVVNFVNAGMTVVW